MIKGILRMKFASFACLFAFLGVASPATAADSFYVGSWTLTAAVVAPWADPHRKPDDEDRARLLGKTVILKSGEISVHARKKVKRWSS